MRSSDSPSDDEVMRLLVTQERVSSDLEGKVIGFRFNLVNSDRQLRLLPCKKDRNICHVYLRERQDLSLNLIFKTMFHVFSMFSLFIS